MALITGITSTAQIAAIMSDQTIVNQILPPNDKPFTHQLLSWYVSPRQYLGNSETVRWPRELSGTELNAGSMSYANPKVEGDDAGYGNAIAFEFAGVEADGEMIGVKRAITFRSVWTGGLDVARVVINSETIVQKRIARDQAAIVVTATNVSNNSGLTLTRQMFGRAKAQFEDQEPTGMYAAVLTPGQIECLKTDLRNDASSMVIGDPEMRAFMASNAAFKGYIEGCPIFEGNYNPDYDASNHFGYFTTIGDGGALGIGQFFDRDDPANGVLRGFKYDMEYDEDTDVWYLWVKAYLAHAITNQNNLRLLVSKKLALA